MFDQYPFYFCIWLYILFHIFLLTFFIIAYGPHLLSYNYYNMYVVVLSVIFFLFIHVLPFSYPANMVGVFFVDVCIDFGQICNFLTP